MGFWDGYRASLKPADVEEPIDRWLHRPVAYLVARASLPTPVSPNAITMLSIAMGLGAAACLIIPFPWHLQVGGGLVFASAVFDCADGQLARMRGTSSAFGRMLDGIADLIVVASVAPATLYVIWRTYSTPMWLGVTVVVLGVLTMVTSSFHTGMYDHYKNVWLRFTSPTFKEGEDSTAARARWEQTRSTSSFLVGAIWRVYLFYVSSQENYVRKFDPYTQPVLGKLPPYSPNNEAIYRAHAASPLAALRGFFGVGSLMIGLALCNALEMGAVYLLLRLVVLNGVFFLYVRPLQRRSSKNAFEAMSAASVA